MGLSNWSLFAHVFSLKSEVRHTFLPLVFPGITHGDSTKSDKERCSHPWSLGRMSDYQLSILVPLRVAHPADQPRCLPAWLQLSKRVRAKTTCPLELRLGSHMMSHPLLVIGDNKELVYSTINNGGRHPHLMMGGAEKKL